VSDCCSTHTTKAPGKVCPTCGLSCQSVKNKTLYHQVRFPENQTVLEDKYYFCPAKECPVGYFSSADHIFPKLFLRTYQEIRDDKLCYCFDINSEHYLSVLNANNAEAIKSFVMQKTKSGDCACEVKNPSGQCCLAKFSTIQRSAS
jgi:hypothetical protein